MKIVRKRGPGGLETLEVHEGPEPRCARADEILVRIRASSLNYHDFAVASGLIPTAAGRIPMSDGAGEVIAVGDGVTEHKVGDMVISTFFRDWLDGKVISNGMEQVPGDGIDGFACEMVCAPAVAFTRSPVGYTHEQAATLPCAALTAWRAIVVEGEIKPGDWVLVQGTGGVSIFALQFAKAIGARVIATSSSPQKLERLKAIGADHVLNYREEITWGDSVRRLSGGGVDHVVEVGGSGTLPQSIAAARNGAHIAQIGVLSGGRGPMPTAVFMSKQLRMTGITVGTRRSQLDMISAIETLGIKPVIDRQFPLEALADAFRYQESGQHFGKIVVQI